MSIALSRRRFGLGITGLAFAGLSGLSRSGVAYAIMPRTDRFGPLMPDPAGILDLPRGFSYRILSRLGDPMDDGYRVGDRADGMGCFALEGGRIALVRNHELRRQHHDTGPFGSRPVPRAFDREADGRALPGGTSTLIYDPKRARIEAQYQSLAGTIRNCAGGVTPWGSWLTCEEDVSAGHGWVFEVPARARGLVDPVPLKALGRFNHEAAAVDPRTGIVYLTEDRDDSLLYRFLPDRPGQLSAGGRLQALAIRGEPGADLRNWHGVRIGTGAWQVVHWIDLEGVDSAEDDLRSRGHAKGAALFARGEGIHYGQGELYFCCTSGGAAKLGQVFRYRPAEEEGKAGERDQPAMLQNFVESDDPTLFNFGDNLTVAPNGHLVVCEDQYTDRVENHLRGITAMGEVYTIARTPVQTELAGACFAPDGRTLFVNIYSPAMTLAVDGPWIG